MENNKKYNQDKSEKITKQDTIKIKTNQDTIERIKTICIILLSIILFIYLAIGIFNMSKGGKMGFFSLRFYIMASDSNEAGTSSGDLIIARKMNVKRLKQNDDVIYQKNNIMIIKKVSKAENNAGNISIYVENDKNNSEEKLDNAHIVGKVLHRVKGIGNVAMFIQSPLGTVNLILIVICIFILIKKLMYNNKSDDDEESISNDKTSDEE